MGLSVLGSVIFWAPYRLIWFIDRLRGLDRRTIRKALGRYLRRNQIDALMVRRKIVLDLVDQRIAERGEPAVFFALHDPR